MLQRRIIFIVFVVYFVVIFTLLCSATTFGYGPSAELNDKNLVEVKLHRITVDPVSEQPVIFLVDCFGERALPIWIGACEANALYGIIRGLVPQRPLTHDLLKNIIEKSQETVKRVIVTHSENNIYYARIEIDRGGSLLMVDSRPSDAIVLALKCKAPIFVSIKLFDEMAVTIGQKQQAEERYGLSIQELTPLLAQSFSFESTSGVLVTDVREGSRAEKDGVQRGDIIVKIGEGAIEDSITLKKALVEAIPELEAKVFRNKKIVILTIHLK